MIPLATIRAGFVRVVPYLMGLAFALGLAFTAWVVFLRPHAAQVEAVQARADANAATGTVQAAQDALKITVDTQALHGRIDVITKENTDAIRNAPGASAPLDTALHGTGLRALCMYDAYHDSDACHALLVADPEQPAG